jgi:hypothetical protein
MTSLNPSKGGTSLITPLLWIPIAIGRERSKIDVELCISNSIGFKPLPVFSYNHNPIPPSSTHITLAIATNKVCEK